MLEQCPHCNKRMGEKALKEHYFFKHAISGRKGFVNHEIEYKGELLKVMTDNIGNYACRSCVFESCNLEEVYRHDLMVHQLTYEEAKSLNNAKKLFCDICWIEFEEIEHIDRHKQSSKHLLKEQYVVGTGCDICRIKLPELAFVPHEQTERHKLYSNYEKGSGCDLCATSKEELLDQFKQHVAIGYSYDTILRIHQSRNKHRRHRQARTYVKGSGCDICYSSKVIIAPEHISKSHQQIIKRMERIKSKNRAKSARSVYK